MRDVALQSNCVINVFIISSKRLPNKQTRSNYCELPTTRKHSLVQTTTAETLVKDRRKTTIFPATVLQAEQCNWVKVFLEGMSGQGGKSIPSLLPLNRQGD